MLKFRVNSWLQLNSTGFLSNVTLWLFMTIYKETSPVATCPGYGVSCQATLYHIKSDIQTQ